MHTQTYGYKLNLSSDMQIFAKSSPQPSSYPASIISETKDWTSSKRLSNIDTPRRHSSSQYQQKGI